MIDFHSSNALVSSYIGTVLFVVIIGAILWWMKFHND